MRFFPSCFSCLSSLQRREKKSANFSISSLQVVEALHSSDSFYPAVQWVEKGTRQDKGNPLEAFFLLQMTQKRLGLIRGRLRERSDFLKLVLFTFALLSFFLPAEQKRKKMSNPDFPDGFELRSFKRLFPSEDKGISSFFSSPQIGDEATFFRSSFPFHADAGLMHTMP